MSTKSGTPEDKSGGQPATVPGGLPVFTTGWGAGSIQFTDESTFWDKVNKLISDGQLGENLDSAMAGHSSPRVWLFLHEPGEAHLSVAAALNFARELASRDQAVLLLDGDDEEADLTRWAGRQEIDGWIDLVRYGSSVLNCGIPMPFEGRRGYLLGVGSFIPADVTGPEVKDLLDRLKRQADDILVTAPADAVGRLWAAEADLRLLCWDRSQRSASLVNNLLESFESVEIPLTGLVGFGLPKDLDEEIVAIPGELLDELVDEAVVEDEYESTADDQGAAKVLFSSMSEEDEEMAEEEEFAHRKGNSRVFWLVVVVSLLMISAASIYYLKYLKVPSGGMFPVVTQNEETSGERPAVESSLGEEAPVESGNTSLPSGTSEDLNDQVTEQSTELPADGEDSEMGQIDPAEAELLPDTPNEVVETPQPKNEFGMDPYISPVGGDGWALHVYSFPDSVRAEMEMGVLAAKGFRSTFRAVEFKDKGRWFRVYIGNFKTKKEANAARNALMEKLGEDWANPVRF